MQDVCDREVVVERRPHQRKACSGDRHPDCNPCPSSGLSQSVAGHPDSLLTERNSSEYHAICAQKQSKQEGEAAKQGHSGKAELLYEECS